MQKLFCLHTRLRTCKVSSLLHTMGGHGHGNHASAAPAAGEVRSLNSHERRNPLASLSISVYKCPQIIRYPTATPPLQPTPFLADPSQSTTARCKRRWNDVSLLRLDAMSPSTYAGALGLAEIDRAEPAQNLLLIRGVWGASHRHIYACYPVSRRATHHPQAPTPASRTSLRCTGSCASATCCL